MSDAIWTVIGGVGTGALALGGSVYLAVTTRKKTSAETTKISAEAKKVLADAAETAARTDRLREDLKQDHIVELTERVTALQEEVKELRAALTASQKAADARIDVILKSNQERERWFLSQIETADARTEMERTRRITAEDAVARLTRELAHVEAEK